MIYIRSENRSPTGGLGVRQDYAPEPEVLGMPRFLGNLEQGGCAPLGLSFIFVARVNFPWAISWIPKQP